MDAAAEAVLPEAQNDVILAVFGGTLVFEHFAAPAVRTGWKAEIDVDRDWHIQVYSSRPESVVIFCGERFPTGERVERHADEPELLALLHLGDGGVHTDLWNDAEPQEPVG